MSTLTLSPSHAAPAIPASSRGLGLLLIAEGLLAFAPIAVLGPAIGWPASLGRPAAEQLASIHAHADAVAWGYGLYLLYSVLVAPVMILLAARVFGGLQRPLGATVAAFAALSALARAIGILRWLTVMPALATAHAAADAGTRAQIELLFGAVTSWGGGIGELLGVGLFMALAVGTLCLGALRHGGMPRSLAALGLLSSALLAAVLLPALRVPLQVPMAAVVTLLTLWMLACGSWLLLRQGR
jgi:Domain of unknown function (DUF4386)